MLNLDLLIFSNCLKMINILWIETCRSYDIMCKKFNLNVSAFVGLLCELFVNART